MNEGEKTYCKLIMEHFYVCGSEKEIFCNTLEQHRHCRYWDRSFTTDYKCRRHFNDAHGRRAVDVKGKMCYPCKVRHKNLGKCERAHYQCPICDSILFIRQRFQNHMLSHDKSLQAVNPEVTSVKDESVTQEENNAN